MPDFGYSFYGQDIGILVFNGKSPRAIGDPGHAKTFSFDVCYETVEGKFSDLINGSKEIKNKLIESVLKLESKGVKAVVGDCGLMLLYQDEITRIASIPFVSSSLTLIPFINSIIKKNSKIGLITGHSKFLNENHFRSININCMDKIVIQGMEEENHFYEIVINGGKNLDTSKLQKDTLSAVKKLIERDKNISAILLECTNLASYSYYIYKEFNIPVFDINSAVNLIYSSISPQKFFYKA